MFWRSTLLELVPATRGLNKLHGIEDEPAVMPCTRDEMNALIERFGG